MPTICNKTSIFFSACLLGSMVSATALPAQAVNASTGFSWAVDQFDKQILELVDSEANYKANTVGASGEVSFLFRARAPGASTIELKNWRHWEGDSSITRRFHLQVQVDH